MPKKYYLAYGSNLNVNQMSFRCPGAKIIGTAMLKGWQLLFKGSGSGFYLTIEKREGSELPVAVWEITDADEKNLDCYEGYPIFYTKRTMMVRCKCIADGKTRILHAMVYTMRPDREPGLPRMSYVDTCLDGYRVFGFNTAYLEQAIDYTKEVM